MRLYQMRSVIGWGGTRSEEASGTPRPLLTGCALESLAWSQHLCNACAMHDNCALVGPLDIPRGGMPSPRMRLQIARLHATNAQETNVHVLQMHKKSPLFTL
jgi:hypothetical protein